MRSVRISVLLFLLMLLLLWGNCSYFYHTTDELISLTEALPACKEVAEADLIELETLWERSEPLISVTAQKPLLQQIRSDLICLRSACRYDVPADYEAARQRLLYTLSELRHLETITWSSIL